MQLFFAGEGNAIVFEAETEFKVLLITGEPIPDPVVKYGTLALRSYICWVYFHLLFLVLLYFY